MSKYGFLMVCFDCNKLWNLLGNVPFYVTCPQCGGDLEEQMPGSLSDEELKKAVDFEMTSEDDISIE